MADIPPALPTEFSLPVAAAIVDQPVKWNVWNGVPGIYKAVRLNKTQQGDAYFLDANTAVLASALGTTFSISGTAGDATPEVAWSDPESVVTSYGLAPLRDKTRAILAEMFGPTAELAVEVANDPAAAARSLIFRLRVPRSMRASRQTFVTRYSHETVLPDFAPAPVLMWSYKDDVSA